MNERLLVINPGSTSTKVALYEGDKNIFTKNITHTSEALAPYKEIYDQYEMRRDLILKLIKEEGIDLISLDAVVARGGLLPPVKSGAYLVNQEMIDKLRYAPVNEHASNLGAAIAESIAHPLGINAYIYDPVTVDEMLPIARISGLPGIERMSLGHNLNMRAAALKYAKDNEKDYKDLTLIVAHLGGGITLSLHKNGRMIDMVSDEEGPFSPERSGGLPIFQVIKLATTPGNDYKNVMKLVRTNAGLKGYFGTTDAKKVEEMIKAGDKKAALIYEAMAEDIAKNIGKLAVVVNGQVDAIILTGGMAYSKMLTGWIIKRVSFISEVTVMPGENEMLSLAEGILRVLRGEEDVNIFTIQ